MSTYLLFIGLKMLFLLQYTANLAVHENSIGFLYINFLLLKFGNMILSDRLKVRNIEMGNCLSERLLATPLRTTCIVYRASSPLDYLVGANHVNSSLLN